jgi:hypothetical protein
LPAEFSVTIASPPMRSIIPLARRRSLASAIALIGIDEVKFTDAEPKLRTRMRNATFGGQL